MIFQPKKCDFSGNIEAQHAVGVRILEGSGVEVDKNDDILCLK